MKDENELLTRVDFKLKVFGRDKHKCIICGQPAVDAHHLIDRKQFNDGGYYLNNGVSLCSDCHFDAEKGILSCEELRLKANIKEVILPDGFDNNLNYNKWGEII